jgi:hypothetical protein
MVRAPTMLLSPLALALCTPSTALTDAVHCISGAAAHGSAAMQAAGGRSPPLAPPLTLQKYEKMQQRRVDVVVEWAGDGFGARRAAEACKIVKALCPDARVHNHRLHSSTAACYYCMRIDGKLLTASQGMSAYLPRRRILDEVAHARRLKRPPHSVYGPETA